jgi:hypothetical protein
MQEFRISVPVNGMINLSIYAESLEEAVEKLVEKQPELESIPNGFLSLELDHVIIIPIDPKTFN